MYNFIITLIILFCFLVSTSSAVGQNSYMVNRIYSDISIVANWNKKCWKKTKAIYIKNYMGKKPKFKPKVLAKILYNDTCIFIIFRVNERGAISRTTVTNGPVWEDSAVEFFFATNSALPQQYFNFEVNCGGTALLRYNTIPRKDYVKLTVKEVQAITISSSMPRIVDPEIRERTTWTLECRIPFSILNKYAISTTPLKGMIWRANLYKIAIESSNAHYMTWTRLIGNSPDFHQPENFGEILFN